MREPESRRDVADRVGITERAAQKIVRDLAEADVLTKKKTGSRNTYEVHRSSHLRQPVDQSATVGELIDLVQGSAPPHQDRGTAPAVTSPGCPAVP